MAKDTGSQLGEDGGVIGTVAMGKDTSEDAKNEEKKGFSLNFKFLDKQTIQVAGGVLAGIIAISLIAYILLSDDKKRVAISQDIIKKIQSKPIPEDKPSKLQNMIKEAEQLYKNGETDKALDLYDKIGKYEEFLTFHNLGVGNMKNKEYKKALLNFQKSIENEGNKCVSSINAAVASLYLQDDKLFKHYITLAKGYLPSVSKDPLYNYYYSLIMYYQDKYIEALSIIRNKKIDSYKQEKYQLASRMLAMLNDDFASIEYLDKQTNKDNLALGLMYSKIGEHKTAISHLKLASKNSELGIMALYMNYLKDGDILNAYSSLDEIIEKYINAPSKSYPIKVFLKDSIFDINKAQQNFKQKLTYPDKMFYKLFMYFSPYKIYNDNQIISYIRKGNKSFYIDDVTFSKQETKSGNDLSKLNIQMAKGIKLAINYKIRSANKIFMDLSKEFKFNSILSYNLGLSFAQLGHFGKAVKNFNKSYSLNHNNKLSPILSSMSSRLANFSDSGKILDSITREINNEDIGKQENLFYESVIRHLRGILDDKYIYTTHKSEHGVLDVFYKMILASSSGLKTEEKKFSKELMDILGDNIISNILNFYVHNKNSSRREMAQNAIIFMKTNEVFLDTLYYGPVIAKEMYIEMAHISGMGHILRDILKERLIIEKHDTRGIMQSLAFLDIYLGFFEESFSIYNTLIDDFEENDSHTLFMASVAAMGANKNANAIALLELSILDSHIINTEARFALAMLYQENFNLKSARIHLKAMKGNTFKSKYFDFKLRNN